MTTTTIVDQFLDSVNTGKIDVLGAPMEGIIDNCREWIYEGWGLDPTWKGITAPMIAASLFNEANSQDKCVDDGDTHPDFPPRLRWLGYAILKVDGHEPEFTARVTSRFGAIKDSGYDWIDAVVDCLEDKD